MWQQHILGGLDLARNQTSVAIQVICLSANGQHRCLLWDKNPELDSTTKDSIVSVYTCLCGGLHTQGCYRQSGWHLQNRLVMHATEGRLWHCRIVHAQRTTGRPWRCRILRATVDRRSCMQQKTEGRLQHGMVTHANQRREGRLTPGKRSARMPSNRGMSGARNLGWFTSLMERSMSSSSDMSPHFCLLAPAARSTLMTALMP